MLEMRGLRAMIGVARPYRMKNEEFRREAEMKERLITKLNRRKLRWFDYMERMDEVQILRRLMKAEVVGSRPRFVSMDGWSERGKRVYE